MQVAWVPGSFELPLVAKGMAKSGKYDAVVCIGAVVSPPLDILLAGPPSHRGGYVCGLRSCRSYQ